MKEIYEKIYNIVKKSYVYINNYNWLSRDDNIHDLTVLLMTKLHLYKEWGDFERFIKSTLRYLQKDIKKEFINNSQYNSDVEVNECDNYDYVDWWKFYKISDNFELNIDFDDLVENYWINEFDKYNRFDDILDYWTKYWIFNESDIEYINERFLTWKKRIRNKDNETIQKIKRINSILK